jgi:hypothetical protein
MYAVLLTCFQLSENGIENLYKYDNSGYLCRPKMFERDGELYNLGGYGLWNHNSDLLVFKESMVPGNLLQLR